MKQSLPIFPEVLKKGGALMERSPLQQQEPRLRSLVLQPEAMEGLGLLRMPQMEPLVTTYLHPQLLAMCSKSPSLPSEFNHFDSVLTEKT